MPAASRPSTMKANSTCPAMVPMARKAPKTTSSTGRRTRRVTQSLHAHRGDACDRPDGPAHRTGMAGARSAHEGFAAGRVVEKYAGGVSDGGGDSGIEESSQAHWVEARGAPATHRIRSRPD